MTGREHFLKTYKDFMSPRLPLIAAEYAKLPAGFRKLLAVQSRQPELADKALDALSATQLQKLVDANEQLADLCAKAGRSLRRAAMTKR